MTQPAGHDHIVSATWLIPVEPARTVLADHAVVVIAGRIEAVLPITEARQCYPDLRYHHCNQHALVPGFVNAHGHAAMTLFRGMADDLPLMTWLNDHIWPAESRWVSTEFVRDGAGLAVAEMLMSGTTCFSDMYFFPEATAAAAAAAGIRAQIAFPILDTPTVWGSGPDEYIAKGLALFDQYKHNPLIRVAFGPHAPYTVSDGPLERVVMFATELDACVQMHVHETDREVADAVTATGERPIARLRRLGLLTPRFQAVHATALNNDDIATLAEANAHVVHCPESNLKLASGFCPVAKLAAAGINVALGTDGAASNNDLDLPGEMRTAALLAKAVAGDTAAVDAFSALEIATINGATALGMERDIGSLAPGKAADMVAIDLGRPDLQPVFNPLSQLVYTHISSRINHVWIDGRLVVEQQLLSHIDAENLASRARRWREQIDNGS